jgi:hypothetical protein
MQCVELDEFEQFMVDRDLVAEVHQQNDLTQRTADRGQQTEGSRQQTEDKRVLGAVALVCSV